MGISLHQTKVVWTSAVIVLAPQPHTAATLGTFLLEATSLEHARKMGSGQEGHHTVDVRGYAPLNALVNSIIAGHLH